MAQSIQYTEEELFRLHETLYDIFGEIIRVCEKCNISYFIIGGSGIGAFFDKAILPWDDDIDVGMTRENYNRFLSVAPKELSPDYFLQWVETDANTPFYFAKVRKNNTLFVESVFRNVDIHHGIYVDVFPFDKVPDVQWIQQIHRALANFLNGCFMGKTIWQWKYCGHCDVDEPRPRGFLPCLLTRIVCSLFTKRFIYRMLSFVLGLFNSCKTTYYNMVLMPRDHISVKSIEHPQTVKFGPLTVVAPSDLEPYLRNHYPGLTRDVPKEEQISHRPSRLSFDSPS